MKHILLLTTLFWFSQTSAQELVPKLSETEFTIGKTIEIHSNKLKEKRTLNIYLPQGYDENTDKEYPVIYLLDGSKDEDFIHISGLVQFGSFSWINMVPESIVVGIANVDRKRDFTYPSQNELDQHELPTSGKSSLFIGFIEDELQPFIEAEYRTSSVKTLIGQSLGGLLTTEILFTKPELFQNYIIVSPSLWWDEERLLDTQPVAYSDQKSIYIAGGKEGDIMERIAKELYQKLEQSSGNNTSVYYEFLEDKDHGDALHIAVYHAFEKIFAKTEE